MPTRYGRGFYLIIIGNFLLLSFVNSQSTQTGTACTSKIGLPGHCKSLGHCHHAVKDLFSKGTVPKHCGTDSNNEDLFCCTEEVVSRNLKPKNVGKKSREKCQEFGRYITINDQIFFPGEDVSKVLPPCQALDSQVHITAQARSKEFPHMAAIGVHGDNNQKMWLCSGSLISEQFVLTSANCLHSFQHRKPKFVRIGDLNLESSLDDAQFQEYRVAWITKHPEFLFPFTYNDIALVKMDRAARVNDYVRPACLATGSDSTFEKALQTGWGKYMTHKDSEFDPHLLKDSVEHFSHFECNSSYNKGMSKPIIQETQVCAGHRTKRDTCMLTTGGPLQIYTKDIQCSYTIVGIASFGNFCGSNVTPIVFTKVSAYIDWIERIVWPLDNK